MPWTPTRIAIEPTFDEFVVTFHSGIRVDRSGLKIQKGHPNADYYFREDDVIAELKCLETDAREIKQFSERLVKAYTHLGYTESDLFGYLFRGQTMPADVAERLLTIESRSLVEAVKKADKQIRATKRLLARPYARGLVLVANDNNYALNPSTAILAVCSAFRSIEERDRCTDAIVYFSPNVYYDDGTNVAKTVWSPIYNVGSEDFAEFVNELGKKWGDFAEQFGEPYLERKMAPDLLREIAHARPIDDFKRR